MNRHEALQLINKLLDPEVAMDENNVQPHNFLN